MDFLTDLTFNLTVFRDILDGERIGYLAIGSEYIELESIDLVNIQVSLRTNQVIRPYYNTMLCTTGIKTIINNIMLIIAFILLEWTKSW